MISVDMATHDNMKKAGSEWKMFDSEQKKSCSDCHYSCIEYIEDTSVLQCKKHDKVVQPNQIKCKDFL